MLHVSGRNWITNSALVDDDDDDDDDDDEDDDDDDSFGRGRASQIQ
jgi:hypothetical protein